MDFREADFEGAWNWIRIECIEWQPQQY